MEKNNTSKLAIPHAMNKLQKCLKQVYGIAVISIGILFSFDSRKHKICLLVKQHFV